jgi:hypothetical protein
MYNIYFFGFDQIDQALPVFPHHPRILAADVARDMLGSAANHLLDQRSAGTDDKRAMAGGDQGHGDVDGCTFGPADIKARHDLQDGHFLDGYGIVQRSSL